MANQVQLSLFNVLFTRNAHFCNHKSFGNASAVDWILDLASSLKHECFVDDGKEHGEDYYKKSWIIRAFNIWGVLGYEYPIFDKTVPNNDFYGK